MLQPISGEFLSLQAPLAAQPPLRQRFLREARTAAKLSHPHIIPIFAVEEVGSFVFFVMAYVDSLTADLAAARDVGEEVERLLAGHDEVAALLARPTTLAS